MTGVEGNMIVILTRREEIREIAIRDAKRKGDRTKRGMILTGTIQHLKGELETGIGEEVKLVIETVNEIEIAIIRNMKVVRKGRDVMGTGTGTGIGIGEGTEELCLSKAALKQFINLNLTGET